MSNSPCKQWVSDLLKGLDLHMHCSTSRSLPAKKSWQLLQISPRGGGLQGACDTHTQTYNHASVMASDCRVGV